MSHTIRITLDINIVSEEGIDLDEEVIQDFLAFLEGVDSAAEYDYDAFIPDWRYR